MTKETLTLEDFNFDLPEELIAQQPVENRDRSRLMVVSRKSDDLEHHSFYELTDLLIPGDMLVLNNARVIPSRIFFRRETGAHVEFIFTRRLAENRWQAICNRSSRLRKGEILYAISDNRYTLTVLDRVEDSFIVGTTPYFTEDIFNSIGEIPLPPYIRRKPSDVDGIRYQTIFASEAGAVAAPTAGLHFNESLITNLTEKGIDIVYLTLYVSWGTFQPVREQELRRHKMHEEEFFLPELTSDQINKARREGRRIVAVGTTVLRVLESTYQGGINIPGRGSTNIFIYPPYEIKSINALITNFHTPNSTLLMLVAAFVGYDKIMEIYRQAIQMRYRFFSYGDAMLIK